MKEGFVSKEDTKNVCGEVTVYSGTTFDIAKRYCQYGKVAVLNFANPEFPAQIYFAEETVGRFVVIS